VVLVESKNISNMIYFTSNFGLELIKSFEDFRSKIYICPAGIETIGYGHVLKNGEYFDTISESTALTFLKYDIAKAEKAVIRNIKIPIAQNQFDALVSFTFNVGGGALQRSILRQKINYGSSLEEIGREFLCWVYSKGRKLPGLVRRRMIESKIYLGR